MATMKMVLFAVLFGIHGLVQATPWSHALSKRGIIDINVCYKIDPAEGCHRHGLTGCCHKCCQKVIDNDMPWFTDRSDWNLLCSCGVQLGPTPPKVPDQPSPPPVQPPPPQPQPQPQPPQSSPPPGYSYYATSATLSGTPVLWSGPPPRNTVTYYVKNQYPQMGNGVYWVSGLTPMDTPTLYTGPPPPDSTTYYVPI